MSELRACPCGRVPTALVLHFDGPRPKWAWATGNCCDGWGVEFRNDYAEQEGAMPAAIDAWNGAGRAGDGEGGE